MTRPPGLPCPVCGLPAAGAGPAPCPACGLPAVGEAALVVARIGATIGELTRDRERLLATLRAAAPGPAPVTWPAPPPPAAPLPPPVVVPPPPPWSPGDTARAEDVPPVRRLSPQQVLVGLGAVLLVAGALAFVAVAWNRLGVAGQAAVLLAVTAALCSASAWTARRGLRATEEALAAAGAALLAVDLGAAHALGLAGIDAMPLRLWWALSCAVVVVVALVLGRVTSSTVTWPLVALLAAQPVPLLLLPGGALDDPAGAAVLLALAAADLLAFPAVRPLLRPVARTLALLAAGAGAVVAIAAAWDRPPAQSWTATALLAAAGAAALLVPLLTRWRPELAAALPRAVPLAGTAAAVPAVALTGSLHGTGPAGAVVATAAGLVLLTAAVVLARSPVPLAGTLAAGGTLTLGGTALLLDADRFAALSPLVLALAVPAALAAVRLPELRSAAVGVALGAPMAAALLATEGGVVGPSAAGLVLAVVGAVAFGIAATRADRPEEPVAAGAAAVGGLLAGLTTSTTGAWGQVAVQLTVVGAAAVAYGLVAGRRPVAALAVGELVVASWIAVGGAGIETVEAYTLPAALGLLLVALPGLRRNAPSWSGEGPALGVALLPSALAAVADPSAVRFVLVVVAAGGAAAIGAFVHRQAPFVLGAAALAWVVLARLAPYAPLLPRWITLGTVGLLLLVLGATYERRRQQAREAVAWVAQMG
ncbi:DUF2157 domain-containing protein [Blastococcus sp. TF02A-26]|uniref:DUF2157 domain-containing protein n=1 Tax=Blastococcus sp. TF02A-26 TaxID=2250577 RepID=UPI000DEA606C|nr:DUF2157 domain-containing protein [Blastococcus sp. TF02A-26]RBY90888.1 hypothetical protein DQ240_01025 [Blastococcus sp. TF02A-26]